MLKDTGSNPVHLPKDPSKFEFDEEVTAVFQNMAVRSIPHYEQAHALHVSMMRETLAKGASVLDVGASRGEFLRQIFQAGHNAVDYTAVDSSPAMCAELALEFPDAKIVRGDVSSPEFSSSYGHKRYDVVCCNYVLQFISPMMQASTLNLLCSLVKRGGYFILGHKAQAPGELGAKAQEEYVKFRLGNGYTREEIEAKTAALRASMHPMKHSAVLHFLEQRFDEVQETTRFMMFSTLIAKK